MSGLIAMAEAASRAKLKKMNEERAKNGLAPLEPPKPNVLGQAFVIAAACLGMAGFAVHESKQKGIQSQEPEAKTVVVAQNSVSEALKRFIWPKP